MTMGMVLEMLTLGIVLPALSLLAGGVSGTQSRWVQWFSATLGNPSSRQLLLGGLLVLLVVYMCKTLFLAYLSWFQARFVAQLQASVARRLFSLYLGRPWSFHLTRNSASLIHNVTSEVVQFTHLATAFATLGSEILVVAGISMLLLLVEPAGAVGVALLLAVSTWLLQQLLRKRLHDWGISRRHHERLRSKHLHQGLGGAKEAKLLGREPEFLAEYERHNAMCARLASRVNAVMQFPRLWYELFAVGGLTLLAGVLALQGTTGTELVARLGLFAVAAFRLLPSVNRIVNTWQTVTVTRPVITALYDELSTTDATAPMPSRHRRRLPFTNVLAVHDVWLRYEGASEPALQGISLHITPGAAIGIIGGSGAGKSTLIDVILGLLEPDRGAVQVDGVDVSDRLREWQNNVGYVPQSIYLSDDTIRRNVAFGVPPAEIDDEAVQRAITAAQLDSFINTLPDGLATVAGERGVRLSGGQRQRIGIARALYTDPAVLVLDEATSSLDTDTERGVMDAVNALHGTKTLIIVAHRLSTVARCDELIRLEKGRIVWSGSYADMAPSH